MARNEEKAQAQLNRWWSMKRQLNITQQEKRPHLASDVNSLSECEKWRLQLIREISRKVSQIQNAGLGEVKIRELNDRINKLLKEKNYWEQRIMELGGPNYHKSAPKLFDMQGQELPGSSGYRYFGAAKDLPGVRELFQKQVPLEPKQSRTDLYKLINYEYYGIQDNYNQEMIDQEQQLEHELRQEELENWILENKNLLQQHFQGKNIEELTEYDIIKLIDQDISRFKEDHETIQVLYKNYDQNYAKEDVIEGEGLVNSNTQQELELRKQQLIEKFVTNYDQQSLLKQQQDIQSIDYDNEDLILKELIQMNK